MGCVRRGGERMSAHTRDAWEGRKGERVVLLEELFNFLHFQGFSVRGFLY
jgi:hypothetical protein